MEPKPDLSKFSTLKLRGELKRWEKRRNALLAAFPYLEDGSASLTAQYAGGPVWDEHAEAKSQLTKLKLELIRREQLNFPEDAAKKEPARKAASAVALQSGFSHSPDYRSVTLRHQTYPLTSQQAQMIQILHRAHEGGNPDVSIATILEEFGTPNSRWQDTFKRKGDARKALVRSGETKGTLRLNL